MWNVRHFLLLFPASASSSLIQELILILMIVTLTFDWLPDDGGLCRVVYSMKAVCRAIMDDSRTTNAADASGVGNSPRTNWQNMRFRENDTKLVCQITNIRIRDMDGSLLLLLLYYWHGASLTSMIRIFWTIDWEKGVSRNDWKLKSDEKTDLIFNPSKREENSWQKGKW